MTDCKTIAESNRFIVSTKNSDYLKKARKYGHFTGYEN